MANIQKIEEKLDSGSNPIEKGFLTNDELPEVLIIKLLKEKIDELVEEINKLKE